MLNAEAVLPGEGTFRGRDWRQGLRKQSQGLGELFLTGNG